MNFFQRPINAHSSLDEKMMDSNMGSNKRLPNGFRGEKDESKINNQKLLESPTNLEKESQGILLILRLSLK